MSESRLPIHPYAEIFPPMSSPEFDGFCGDILQKGLQEPIVLHEGKVLDGWHRYLACLVEGVRRASLRTPGTVAHRSASWYPRISSAAS